MHDQCHGVFSLTAVSLNTAHMLVCVPRWQSPPYNPLLTRHTVFAAVQQPKVKTTPWGSTYRPAPEILHGYSHKVKGDTASERLDMRAATKADKFCK